MDTNPVTAADRPLDQIAAEAVPVTEAPQTEPLRDYFGRAFNPTIHYTKRNGQPKIGPDGLLMIRPGHMPSGEEKPPGDKTDSTWDTLEPTEDNRLLVGQCFKLLDYVLTKTLGDEAAADPKEEKMMVDTWAKYLTYRRWESRYAPELAILLVTLVFATPRLILYQQKVNRPAKYVRNESTEKSTEKTMEDKHA